MSTEIATAVNTEDEAKDPVVLPENWDGWPDGSFERTYTNAELKQTDNLAVNWVCEVAGPKSGSDEADDWRKGRKSERRCRGVLACPEQGCTMVVRPQTRMQQILKQLDKPCLCGGSLVRLECRTVQKLYRFKHGIHYIHEGVHDHPRPTHLLHLDRRQRQEFQALVEGNPKSGPLQLLVGAPTLNGPGRSAAEISPILVNKDRIAYEVKKVRQKAQSSNAPDQLSISTLPPALKFTIGWTGTSLEHLRLDMFGWAVISLLTPLRYFLRTGCGTKTRPRTNMSC